MSKQQLDELMNKLSVEKQDYLVLHVNTKESNPLFECRGGNDQYSVKITSKCDTNEKKVVLALMISGIINLHLALTHGSTKETMQDNSITTHDASEFSSWFSKMAKNRILVLDTNAILDRSISSLRYAIGEDSLESLQICIPRFSILEMERIANKSEKNEKKRQVLSASAELGFLKEHNAQFLPELEKETFEGFSRLAKEQVADSWIRREIRGEIKRQTIHIDSDKVKRVTLLTADLVNALSAVAEGIDTIFISKVDYDKKSTRSSRLKQVTQLIIMTAILFEEIKISMNNKNYLCKGMWEGKTSLECLTDSIRFMEYG